MNMYYKLEGKQILPLNNVIEWAEWFEKAGKDRVVGHEKLPDGSEVSTVFLGIDHSPIQRTLELPQEVNPSVYHPLIFETMVFGGPFDGHQCRYHTWDEAYLGHQMVVADLVKIQPRELYE